MFLFYCFEQTKNGGEGLLLYKAAAFQANSVALRQVTCSTMYVSTIITYQQYRNKNLQAFSRVCNPIYVTYSNTVVADGRLSGYMHIFKVYA